MQLPYLFRHNNDKYHIDKLDENDDHLISVCAHMMASIDPWKKIGRDYKKNLIIFRNAEFDHYCISKKDQIIGFIILDMIGPFTGYVKSIGLHPNNQGQGIGAKAFAFIEQLIFQTHPNVFLTVSSFNSKAKNFYLKLGYEEIGELKNLVIKGHSEILMRKTIGPLMTFVPKK